MQVGDAAVMGFVVPAPKEPTGYFLEVYDISGGTPVFLDRRPVDRIDAATGAFSVALTAGPRQRFVVGNGAVSGDVMTSPFEVRPVLRRAMYDGARLVEGYLPTRAGASTVRVRVMRSALESDIGSNAYEQVKSVAVGTDDVFSVTLDRPLIAGQVVQAEALTAGQVAGPVSDAVVVTDPGSWGRARAYFAGGAVFSKERQDFSQQDLAISFVIDKGWLQAADYRLEADKATRQAFQAGGGSGTAGAQQGKWTFRQLNTFFDGRLTALPVIAPAQEGSTAPTGQTTGTQQSEADAFVASRKSALLQVGVYAPVYGPQTSWVHEGAVNALFIAPIFRVGIQSIVSSDGSPATDLEGRPDDVFNFWSAGFGFGHQRLSGTTNQTPEIISYMHVTLGTSEAFAFKEGDGAAAVIRKPMRIFVEARLKIPEAPLQIGFDGNLGQGRDDLRFVFGTRFDVGEAFQRLRSF